MCVETTETLFSSCLDRLFQHVRTRQFERFGPRTLSDRLGVSTLKNAAGTPAKVFHFWPKSENHDSDQMEGYTSASMRENIKNTSNTLLTLQIHLANAMGVLPDLPHGFMTQSGCARFGQITPGSSK